MFQLSRVAEVRRRKIFEPVEGPIRLLIKRFDCSSQELANLQSQGRTVSCVVVANARDKTFPCTIPDLELVRGSKDAVASRCVIAVTSVYPDQC